MGVCAAVVVALHERHGHGGAGWFEHRENVQQHAHHQQHPSQAQHASWEPPAAPCSIVSVSEKDMLSY